MTLPRTVAEVLTDHVTFEVECIDRMYLNCYVPGLQYPAGLVAYVHNQLGLPIASTAPLADITRAFDAAVHRYAREGDIPWVDFKKGQRKDEVMHEHLAAFEAAGRTEGVLLVGRAQEKVNLFRTQKRHRADGAPYPWIVPATGVVNQFYFYAVDADFGPFFLKFCSYFPYNARLCINGHHWAQAQAAKAGLKFEAMDNAFAAVEDPAALQAICAQLGAEQIDALLRKWLAVLPHPFSAADRAAGYTYQLSVLQAEFSLTQMLDAPITGRIFFEQVIRDNLDLGRPDQVSLIFNKRIHRGRKQRTPGRFRTRVITEGVTPSLHVDYKSSRIKQYHKEGRALRTETTINNPGDFGLRKGLTNLPALREVGFLANRRLLGVQRISHDPARGHQTFHEVNDPVTTPTGTRVPGLRFTDPRVHALLRALLLFRLLPHGFTNRDLRTHVADLLGVSTEEVSSGQITYDLRRLRLHRLIERRPHSHRYTLTDAGLTHALFLTRVHDRILTTGMDQTTSTHPNPLARASTAYDTALQDLITESGLPA